MKLSEELKSYLDQAAYALVCVTLDLGNGSETVVIVKSTADLIDGLAKAKATVGVGWLVEQTDQGPVACMCIKCADDNTGELVGETYFDLINEDELDTLEGLVNQPRLKVAMFDEEMDLKYLADARWGALEQLYAQQAFDRAEELMEKTEVYDFEKARDLFQDKVNLEKLVASILDDEDGGDEESGG